jgi:hypothetical protein
MSDIKNSQAKQDKILEFLKAFEEIEESIRPFAESRKDLRKSFIEKRMAHQRRDKINNPSLSYREKAREHK